MACVRPMHLRVAMPATASASTTTGKGIPVNDRTRYTRRFCPGATEPSASERCGGFTAALPRTQMFSAAILGIRLSVPPGRLHQACTECRRCVSWQRRQHLLDRRLHLLRQVALLLVGQILPDVLGPSNRPWAPLGNHADLEAALVQAAITLCREQAPGAVEPHYVVHAQRQRAAP
jgi:hypothetical protein